MTERSVSRRAVLISGLAATIGGAAAEADSAGRAHPAASFRATAGFFGRPEAGCPLRLDPEQAARLPADASVMLERLHIDLDAAERVWLTDEGRTIWGPHLLPAGFTEIRFDGRLGGIAIRRADTLAIGMQYGSHGTAAAYVVAGRQPPSERGL